jgi:anti-sigma B factor antagonist
MRDAGRRGVVTAGRDDAPKRRSRILPGGGFLGMLSFTTKQVQGVLVIAFEATDDGTMDWQTGQRDWLYNLIESHPDPRFAIDLTDVHYLASSEIGFLVTLKRRIDRRQGKVVMFGAGDYVTGIFGSMNLTRIIDIEESLPAALAKLEQA